MTSRRRVFLLASTLTLGEARGAYCEQVRIDSQEIGIGLSRTGTIFTASYG